MACEMVQREFLNSKGEPVLVVTRQLAASKALDLQVELLGTVGTIVFPLIENKYNFGSLIQLMRAAEAPVVTGLIKRVVSTVQVDGKEVKPALFDMFFSGELMLVYQIFAFVCEANFLDFFEQGLRLSELRELEAAEALKTEELKLKKEAESELTSQK